MNNPFTFCIHLDCHNVFTFTSGEVYLYIIIAIYFVNIILALIKHVFSFQMYFTLGRFSISKYHICLNGPRSYNYFQVHKDAVMV